MPDVNNINLVIAAIKQAGNNPRHPGVGFCMDFVYVTSGSEYDRSGHACNTVACIAGWSNLVAGREDVNNTRAAAHFLDLNNEVAEALFFPSSDQEAGLFPYDALPAQAVRALEILRDTGQVDWTAAMQKVVEPA